METLKEDKKSGKTLNRYVCKYCGEIFEKSVGRSIGKGKHGTVSSQVYCPQCKNFIKTWG